MWPIRLWTSTTEPSYRVIMPAMAATAFLPPTVSMLAELQAGVATREQLLTAGCTQSQIAAQVEARRWRQINEIVYVLHNGPLTRDQA
jgi:hypothetical protein